MNKFLSFLIAFVLTLAPLYASAAFSLVEVD